MTSHYATLGLRPDATIEQIKTAWRQRSLAQHPDRHPHDPTASDRYRRIREARDCLIDPVARAAHDTELRRAAQAGSREPSRESSLESLFASILVGEWMRHAGVAV